MTDAHFLPYHILEGYFTIGGVLSVAAGALSKKFNVILDSAVGQHSQRSRKTVHFLPMGNRTGEGLHLGCPS